jgi:hypothetical protein
MFQVLIQSAMRQLKSRFRLPAPPNKSPESESKQIKKKFEHKDKTALILKLMLGGSIFLLVIFSILPTG